jgi:hypothetical protein
MTGPVRRWLRKGARTHAAAHNFAWYRAGYIAALDDIERTGLRPISDATKREAADRSLKRWIDADA